MNKTENLAICSLIRYKNVFQILQRSLQTKSLTKLSGKGGVRMGDSGERLFGLESHIHWRSPGRSWVSFRMSLSFCSLFLIVARYVAKM